jgi:hypothetical protein
MELGHEEELGGVEVVPVAKFMCYDGFDLIGLSLLDQRVKNDNVFTLQNVSLETTLDDVRTQGSPKK